MKSGVIIILFSISFKAFSQTQNCRVGINPLKDLQQASEEILKKTQVQEFRSDPKSYCQRNMLLRFINVNNKILPEAKECEGKSIPELEAIADKVAPRTSDWQVAWNASLIPTETSMQRALKLTTTGITRNELSLDELKAHIELAKHPNSSQINAIEAQLDKISKGSASEVRRASGLQRAALCAEMSILSASSCTTGLDIIFNTMMPSSEDTPIMNLPSWRKVMTNQRWQEGLRLAGLKIINRLKSNGSQPGNIFDDLTESFQKSGLTKAESIDASFKVMGVVANGGANTCMRVTWMSSNIPTPAVASLCLIGTAMNVLDFKRVKAGQPPYSYPTNVKADCYYPKPYHFWMAADISRSLVAEHGIDPEGAGRATFLAQKAYQINRDIYSPAKKEIGSVFNKSAFDPVHQVIRMDLAFASAGAQFGIAKDSTKKFNVDNGIEKLIVDGEVRPPEVRSNIGTVDSLINLKNWNQLFSPNSAYDAVNSNP